MEQTLDGMFHVSESWGGDEYIFGRVAILEHVVSNRFDSKHSYFIIILFHFVQFMSMVSTKIIK